MSALLEVSHVTKQFPIGGQPKQDFPIGGAPKQDFPIGGAPKQDLPIGGAPKHEVIAMQAKGAAAKEGQSNPRKSSAAQAILGEKGARSKS